MKRRVSLVLAVVALEFTGCSSLAPGPAVEWSSVKLSGEVVSLETRRFDAHTFEITVYSAGGLTDNQLLDVWVSKADRLAAGRSYEKQAKVEAWEHDGGGPVGEPTPQYVGTKVTGRIVLR